jgi:hypothetical protein
MRLHSGLMRAGLATATAGLALLAAAGCNRSPEPPISTLPIVIPTTPTPTDTLTPTLPPSPTAPATDPAIVFAADGIGPYTIGGSLTDLQDHAQVVNIEESPFCTDYKGAGATGIYAGQVTLTFHAGRLNELHTTSTAYVTPSGGKVGMALTDLQGIYGSRGTLINGPGAKGYSVRVPATALAIVFLLDATNTTVAAMSAGEADPLEDAVRHGEGC